MVDAGTEMPPHHAMILVDGETQTTPSLSGAAPRPAGRWPNNVYLTPTGECYHAAGCESIRNRHTIAKRKCLVCGDAVVLAATPGTAFNPPSVLYQRSAASSSTHRG